MKSFLVLFFKKEQTSLLGFFVLAVCLRAVVISLGASGSDGDWPVYARVAHNILGGCGVSLSAPGAACVPHFGGNGLPGYPAFIAAVWGIFGGGKPAVLWAQGILSALAVPRLAYGMGRLARRPVGWLCGLVAALSPLQAFMAREGLAETLSLAAANWLIAELALSLAGRRLRVVPVAAALLCAVFLRLDSVLFALPVAVVALAIYGVARAVRPGLVVAGLVCVPLALWSVRNMVQGVGVLPPARGWMLPDGSTGPLGYLDWLKQWVTTQDQRSAAAFFAGTDYRMIHILPGRFFPASQAAAANGLIADLRLHTGQPFPEGIDRAFAGLADDARARRGLATTIELRLSQAAGLWARWAEPLPPEVRPGPGGFAGWVKRALTQSLGTLLNTMTRCYRCVLGVGFLTALGLAASGRVHAVARVFVLAAASLVVAKTIVAVAGLFLEARYTVTAVPFMEVAVVLVGAGRFAGRSAQGDGHGWIEKQEESFFLKKKEAKRLMNFKAAAGVHRSAFC